MRPTRLRQKWRADRRRVPFQLKYQLPAGWQEKPPAEMRVASFTAPGPNGAIRGYVGHTAAHRRA